MTGGDGGPDPASGETRRAGTSSPEAGHRLTHPQRQIWIGQQLHPASPLYNMAFAFVLPPGVNEDLLRQAWHAVADGSDALRTTVVLAADGEPRAAVRSDAPGLATAAAVGSAAEFAAWCERRAAAPLSIAGALVDGVLVPFEDGRTGWYLNQHHLVADAWSTVLLFQQVAKEYSHLEGGTPAPPPLASYYEASAGRPEGGAARAGALAHWAARRAAVAGTTPMYGRKAEPAGTASTRLTLQLDAAQSRRIEQRRREAGLASLSDDVSRFAFFATLLVSWLYRIGGTPAQRFDAPVGGRSTAAARRAPGVFIEMFPFAQAVERSDTFRTLAVRCLDETTTMLRHALPGTSAPSAASASGVVLNYVPASFGAFAGRPVAVDWIHPGHGDSVHALRLQVHDFAGRGEYVLHFDFNDAALDDRLRRRSLAHFSSLLDAFLDDPDTCIDAVDVRTPEERRTLAALNETGRQPLPVRSVVAEFEAQAERTPDAVTLREGERSVSFAALRAQTDQLAAALLARGLSPGDRVAIAGRRSRAGVAAILGVLRARGAYVPIDPLAPPARQQHVLVDSGARFVLATDRSLTLPPGSPLEVLAFDEVMAERHPQAPSTAGPELDDLAYLLYTSGSTGRPKGVPIEHGGLADYLAWASRRYVRGSRLTYPLCTSLSFDLTVTSLFLPLITGGTLVIYPEPDGPVDSAVLDVVRDNAVDFIKLTPSHLAVVRRIGPHGSRLRRLVIGGEDLKTSLAADITSQLGDGVEIHNEYGPTEAVVGCVAHLYDARADTGASVPIGAPADHVEVEILNDALMPVPEGVAGELWVSRFGLARGYHGQPELTADRFFPHPLRPGERRYRTGDRVRLRDAATLEYLGRIDRQLKVSGFRVEPGELEALALALPGITGCAVVARRHPAGQSAAASPMTHCVRCGLPSTYPRVSFDTEGVCSICHGYEAIKERAQAYFGTIGDLRELIEGRRSATSACDCLMLYSGGKDSTYALCRLVEMGVSVYAFTLDNGFISAGAKSNIRQVTERLGVPIEFATTAGMAAIFRESLARFSNVCNGCFKTIYTLGMLRARELGIPVVVTGLSRGQMFETRLSADVFEGAFDPDAIDAAVLAARKAYHRTADAVSQAIDVSAFSGDEIFQQVTIVDFYRYCDVSMDEMLAYLAREVPWIRPADTGRSTNCLINDLGIFVHQRERGFHNYALPYSWDVRLGHKTVEAARRELDDRVDPERVRQLLADIGDDQSRAAAAEDATSLAAFYVASEAVPEAAMRQHLAAVLPPALVPSSIRRVEAIPLTANGKVDEDALLRLDERQPANRPFRPPEGPVAEFLAAVWQEELGIERAGADDSFFELGGTSLTAMQMMVRLCREFDIDLPLATAFAYPRLGDLARAAEDRILSDADASPSSVR